MNLVDEVPINPDSAICPMCDGASLEESLESEKFAFGDDSEQIDVDLVVITCSSCGFSFTDARAETARHDAACRHFGLLTPDQIRAVRMELSMSRREFNEAYGIPPASMERWENGKIIQSRSLDTLLRALQDPGFAKQLDRRATEPSRQTASNVVYLKFGALQKKPAALESARQRAESFDFRKSN